MKDNSGVFSSWFRNYQICQYDQWYLWCICCWSFGSDFTSLKDLCKLKRQFSWFCFHAIDLNNQTTFGKHLVPWKTVVNSKYFSSEISCWFLRFHGCLKYSSHNFHWTYFYSVFQSGNNTSDFLKGNIRYFPSSRACLSNTEEKFKYNEASKPCFAFHTFGKNVVAFGASSINEQTYSLRLAFLWLFSSVCRSTTHSLWCCFLFTYFRSSFVNFSPCEVLTVINSCHFFLLASLMSVICSPSLHALTLSYLFSFGFLVSCILIKPLSEITPQKVTFRLWGFYLTTFLHY